MAPKRALKKPAVPSSPGKKDDPSAILPAQLVDSSSINLVRGAAISGVEMLTPKEIVYLQRTLGNRQVGDFLCRLNSAAPVVERAEPRVARAGQTLEVKSHAPATGQPSADPPAPELRVGGATDSKKIVRIAWTFDDGPTEIVTRQMEQVAKGIPSTWYVMRNQIETGDRKENVTIQVPVARGRAVGSAARQ